MRTQPNAVLLDPVRLKRLHALGLLDTAAEDAFDRLTRLAARTLAAPMAVVSLVDDHRQFFKSTFGLPEPVASARETPLSHSFCQYVVILAAPLVVEDARLHPLVATNGAIEALNLLSYLGIPLTLEGGATIGSFCVMDICPRIWTASDLQTMTELAASVTCEIALRSTRHELVSLIEHLARRGVSFELLAAPHADHGVLEIGQHAVVGSHAATSNDVLDAHRVLLTKRQREVFDHLMHGLQTKEVARALNISPRTVEVHRAQILARLQAPSFCQLLQQALTDQVAD